jgi:hypothetical protein
VTCDAVFSFFVIIVFCAYTSLGIIVHQLRLAVLGWDFQSYSPFASIDALRSVLALRCSPAYMRGLSSQTSPSESTCSSAVLVLWQQCGKLNFLKFCCHDTSASQFDMFFFRMLDVTYFLPSCVSRVVVISVIAIVVSSRRRTFFSRFWVQLLVVSYSRISLYFYIFFSKSVLCFLFIF